MAGELQYEIKRTAANGVEQARTQTSGTITTTQANKRQFGPAVYNIGTTEESIAIPADVTPGIAYIRNLDTTNYVQVGTATGVYWARLKVDDNSKGEAMMVPWEPGNTTIYAKADTAACDLWIEVYSR